MAGATSCKNICKAASTLVRSISITSTSSSRLILPSLSHLSKSSIFSRKISSSSFRVTHVLKNPGRVNVRAMSSNSELEDSLKKTIANHPVVVYSKSYCSYSSEVKKLFKWLGVQTIVFELDQLGAQGSQLQDVLGELTGQNTVPYVFIGAKHIGGCTETINLYEKGKLDNLLSEAGVKRDG